MGPSQLLPGKTYANRLFLPGGQGAHAYRVKTKLLILLGFFLKRRNGSDSVSQRGRQLGTGVNGAPVTQGQKIQ
jgi:hypothetical protein